jgi:hypothetical protein
MPRFRLSQYQVDLLLDLVNDEVKSIKRGDTHYENNEDTLADLTVIRNLFEANHTDY